MANKTIFLGHYGSGKTELSLAEAFLLAKKGEKVTLVDLDIVNPYFRSGEQKQRLQEAGIRVIMPNFEGKTVNVPSLPGEINSVFDDKDTYTIFDVGGSPSGAAAIGRYSSKIVADKYEAILVVNTLRPFTATATQICEMGRSIEAKSRIKITSMINNTNAAYQTDADMVQDAQPIVEQAAQMLGVSVKNITALPKVIEKMDSDFKKKYSDILRPVSLVMRPEWLDE